MAVLTSFLWSNVDQDSFLCFKLSFASFRIAEVGKLIFFPSLITIYQPFCDMEGFLSFGILTNSQLFGVSNISAILLTTWDF